MRGVVCKLEELDGWVLRGAVVGIFNFVFVTYIVIYSI